jgi:O-antigen ligase
LISIIATLVFFAYFYDLALSILGKSDTLTGRTRIWSLLTSLWLQRPALGYGFASGFSNRLLPQLSILLNIQYVANAQNGYLQALISLGYVGFSVLSWILYITLKGSARLALEKAGILVMPLLISIYFLEVNIVEAWFTEEHNPSLMLFSVALATVVSRNLRKVTRVPARAELPATRWQIG